VSVACEPQPFRRLARGGGRPPKITPRSGAQAWSSGPAAAGFAAPVVPADLLAVVRGVVDDARSLELAGVVFVVSGVACRVFGWPALFGLLVGFAPGSVLADLLAVFFRAGLFVGCEAAFAGFVAVLSAGGAC
jgi:hypothetical protein